jgi:hypothetical protein
MDPDGTRTVVPFTGATTADDKLFAVTDTNIMDITTGTAAVDLALAATDSTSGYGIWCNFTTIADTFAIYCDETNGYYLYTRSTDTWARVTGVQVTGVNPNNLVAVCVYKERLWFVEKGTGNAWYLPVGSVTGAATRFAFGNKFKSGGQLVNLYTWTVDGGEGVDDHLVAISSAGDVIVYKGDDPSVAGSFNLRGQWFMGPPPIGRRIGGSFGGELYLLSSYGILPLTRLINGALIQEDDIYLSRKITPLINRQMLLSRNVRGWEIKLIPSEQILIVSVPKQAGQDNIQFVQSLNSEGWAIYRTIPYLTGETWQGSFYIGTEDGRVLNHTGNTDIAEPIDWSLLLAFKDYGKPGSYHRAQFIRPVFLGQAAPSYVVEARYDYRLTEAFGAPDPSTTSGSLWDTGLWDSALWGGDYVVVETPFGASGLGRAMSVGLNGKSNAETILIRFDLMIDEGGFL